MGIFLRHLGYQSGGSPLGDAQDGVVREPLRALGIVGRQVDEGLFLRERGDPGMGRLGNVDAGLTPSTFPSRSNCWL